MNVIKFPMIDESYSDTFSRDAMNAARKIRGSYGSIIAKASKAVGIDPNFIIGFMIIENTQLDPLAVSYGCSSFKRANYECSYGLMQMQVPTAYQTIKDQADDLDTEEAAIINKYLPGFVKGGGIVGLLMSWKKQIYEALIQPEFAIWIGAMHLAQLMAKTKRDFGEYRLDHVIVLYNRGIGNYNKEIIQAGLKNASTEVLMRDLPVAETRSYIKKFVGKDGAIMAALRTQ